MGRRVTRRAATVTVAVGAFLLSVGTVAWANAIAQTLPFSQNWTTAGLLSIGDDWSLVPGIVGYRGDDLAAAGTNPQTVTADGSGTPVDVNINLTNPSQNGNPPSGVSEFQIADPTIGLRGSTTADAPHIVMNLNTTGVYGVNVAYVLRDIDASNRNSTSRFALQYRVGSTGAYTDVPAGYVADATTATTATQTTNVSALLPAAADNKALVQVRVITVHSGGTDENVGVDSISVTDTNLLPDNTVPGAQNTDEDAALLFNTANANTVSVSDADDSLVQTHLQITNGTLTLGATAGISFGAGANGTNNMTFTGSQANVNAALDGLRFDPNADYNGPAQLTISTNDLGNTGTGGAKTDTDTVAITVNAVNDVPTVSDITPKTTNEDTVTSDIPFTVGDVETAAGSLTVSGSSSDQTLVPDANITLAGSGANRTVKVTPAANRSGTATINVTAADGVGPGSLSATDTFVLTVDEVNDPVTATGDTKSVAEDGTLVFPASDLTANDSAGPNEGAQTLSVDGASGATHGSVELSGGQITYTPDANYNGPAQFSYNACDSGTPQQCAPSTVYVTVTAVNDAPTVSSIGDEETNEDTVTAAIPFTVDDVEIGASNVVASASSSDQALVPDANIEVGPASPTNGDRSITVTPAADRNGTATITVTAVDGAGPGSNATTETFDLTVNAVNDVPVAADKTLTTDEDEGGDVTFSAADADGDALSYDVVDGPQHGSLSGSGATRTYTPDADYNGSDSFTYRANDGDDGNTATVDVTVEPVNDAPVAQDDTYGVDEDGTLTVNAGEGVLDNDTDVDGDGLAAAAETGPEHGGLDLAADGSFEYTPDADYNGPDSFTYRADDGSVDNTATVEITVRPVNDAPALDLNGVAAGTGYAATFEEDGQAVSIVDDGALSVGDVDDVEMDSAAVELSNPLDAGAESLAVDTAGTSIDDHYDAQSGELLLTGAAPKADYEQVLRTVTYRNTSQNPSTADRSVNFVVEDGAGSSNTATSEVSIDASNDAPIISDVADKATDEDTTAGPYSFTVDDAETGVATLDVSGSSDDQALVPNSNIEIGPVSPTNGDRTVTITPAPDEFGTAEISLTVEDGTDAERLSVTDTFFLTVRDTTPPADPTLDLDASSDTGTSESDEVTKYGKPSFSGDAETGSTVEIFDGATSLGTVTANAGRWGYTVPADAAFSDGDHNVRVRATDAAGNRSGFETLNITVDTQDPETSVTDGPANLVRATAAEFSFHSSQTNSTFECSLDGGAFEACSSPETYSGLAAGLHDFEVFATDRAGNADDSPAQRTWRIDTMTPTVSLTAPAEDAKLRGSVTLQATADDAHGIRRVEFLVDGASVDTDTSAPYDFAWDTTSVSDGTHTLRAWTVDEAGNEATSSPVPVTVDNAAPETLIDEAPAAQTDGTSAVFEFSSDEPGSTFECKLDAGGYEACSSPREYQNLDEGDHTFRVRAADATGNVDGSPAEHAFTVDTSAPPEPVVGSPEDGSFSGSDAVTFSGTGDPGTTVRVSEGTQLVGSATVDGDGNWTITIDGIADGEHAYTIESFDAAGNASGERTVTVTVETDQPAVTVVDPAAGATDVAVEADVRARFSKGIDASTLAGNFTLKKQGDGGAVAADVGYDADIETATLDPGAALAYSTTYTATVADGASGVQDRAGNPLEAGMTWSFTTGEAPDTTAPDAPEITAPADGSYDGDGELSISGTAEPNSTVELFEGAQSRGTDHADENGGWRIDLAGVPEGLHLYGTKATDGANNTSISSTMLGVTVDMTQDDTNITAGPSGTTSDAAATFRFESGEPGGTFECRIDDGQFEACASPESYAGLSDGQHTFRVRSIDRAGNVESAPAERTWTVDGSAPSLEITGGPTGRTSARDATFGLVAEAGASVQCRLDGGQFEACASPESYAGLSDGQHTLTVRATDGAGNLTEATRTWTVDSTAPAVVTVTPGKRAKTTSKITVQFNEDMNAASFTATGAFQLKKGRKAVAIKSVTYDPSTRTVTFTPVKLAKGSYTATLAGVKDLAGNSIAANKVWKFRVG